MRAIFFLSLSVVPAYHLLGVSSGHLLLFDLRLSKPLFVKDHRNERKIHTVKFHNDLVLSADCKVIRGKKSVDSSFSSKDLSCFNKDGTAKRLLRL